MLNLVEEAYAQSNGSVRKVESFLKGHPDPLAQDALSAVQQNILDNPVKLDEVMTELSPGAPLWQRIKNKVWDLPAKLNKHVEDRLRGGMYLAAKKSKQSNEAAGIVTRESLLDYLVPTVENRTMRTYVPFGAFMSQSLPQVGKLLLENVPEGYAANKSISGAIGAGLAGGVARVGAAQMFETDPENPIYPDMVGKLAIPMPGTDDKGNPQYLTSLGLPMEMLGDIPQGFNQREFERFAGTAGSPLVKAAYSFFSGREP
jgi:hypothetical protein